jgi:RNA polymerase sigma factor (sigma-70 family)
VNRGTLASDYHGEPGENAMSFTEIPDAVLVVRCQLGEQQAWEELVTRWQPRLWSFIVRMISDQTVAEDVLQEVWLSSVRSMVRLRDPQQWTSWVYGIARRRIADRFREQYRRTETESLDEIATDDDGIESMLRTEIVEAGLAKLHAMDREVVVLHYLEGLSLAEVAAICSIPVGTAKSRLHRSRQILKHELKD